MTAIADKPSRISTRRPARRAVPPALVYELWDGKPVYYKGYREVLAGKKTSGEVISCSDLQGVLVSLLNGHLFNLIDRKRYLLATNEVGLHLGKKDNLGNDLAIYEKAKLGKLQSKYFAVPPKVVIEVDVKADVADFTNGNDGYLLQKARKLLDFGVERVFWIITSLQKVYIIDHADPTWRIVDWSAPITVLDGCQLNIQQLLTDEEIEY